jgi:tetrapyrrole methylase family protein/MazG family protein
MNSSSDSTQADLYILGAGVWFPEHLTGQTIRILTACKRICSNLPQEDLDSLPPGLRAKCTSLWQLYQENRDRSENYKMVAQAVLDAVAVERPVAWMTPGHPLIFDSVSQALLELAPQQGWKVEVVPAISCIDTVLAQLGYDPAGGLVVYEATSLVGQKLPLLPWFATLLLQPSAFGSSLTHYSSRWTPDLTPLRDHLLNFYPATHRCAFVRSYSPRVGPSQVSWWELGNLTSAEFDVLAGTTLFIPGAQPERGSS